MTARQGHRDLTAEEKERLWQLDRVTPTFLAQKVYPGGAKQYRRRRTNSPEYAALRDYAIFLLAQGVRRSVLADELDVSIRAIDRLAAKVSKVSQVPAQRKESE
jgi:hypothetical protein